MGAVFPFLQSPGTSLDCHGFSNITGNGLASTSANFRGTLGRLSSGATDGHKCDLLLQWEALCSPVCLPCSPSTQEMWEEGFPVDNEAKKGFEYLGLLVIHCYQFSRGQCALSSTFMEIWHQIRAELFQRQTINECKVPRCRGQLLHLYYVTKLV